MRTLLCKSIISHKWSMNLFSWPLSLNHSRSYFHKDMCWSFINKCFENSVQEFLKIMLESFGKLREVISAYLNEEWSQYTAKLARWISWTTCVSTLFFCRCLILVGVEEFKIRQLLTLYISCIHILYIQPKTKSLLRGESMRESGSGQDKLWNNVLQNNIVMQVLFR